MYHTIAKLFVPDCHNLKDSTAVGVASHGLGPALISASCADQRKSYASSHLQSYGLLDGHVCLCPNIVDSIVRHVQYACCLLPAYDTVDVLYIIQSICRAP